MKEKPKRIQLSRRKGWRKPEGVVVVARPSAWGNPFSWTYWRQAAGYSEEAAREMVVSLFRNCLIEDDEPYNPASANRMVWIRDHVQELRGKDLACWCPLNQPCHADVLLEVANS